MGTRSRGLAALVAGAAFLAPAAGAAAGERRPHRDDGRGYFMIGWTELDLDKLNRDLARRGHAPFAEDFLSLGGAGHATRRRFIIGGQGHALLVGDRSSEVGTRRYLGDLQGGIGFLDLGYVAWQRRGFRLAPMLGLGGGILTLAFKERSAPSFDDVLGDPRHSARLSTGGLLVDLGVGADFLLTLGSDDWSRGGVVFGVRGGMILAPLRGDWRLEDAKIDGGPDTGITGPYVRFLVGGGGARLD